MGENYADAALRHWRDAELLKGENRMENADQLYGLSAECAIKSIASGLKNFVDSGAWEANHFKHINALWDGVNLSCVQKAFPNLACLLDKNNPFDDWNVNQRYYSDGCVSTQALDEHRNAVRRIIGATGLNGVRK
jgi:hypothetical protein